MLKAVKVLNIGSTLLFIVILLLIYAYLPISVDLNVEGVKDIHKQQFFYYAITAFIVVNILVRVILNLGFSKVSTNVLGWMNALIMIMNVYLTFMVGFVGVWNNSTHISPSSYAYLNFLGPLSIIIWVGGLIFLVVKKK